MSASAQVMSFAVKKIIIRDREIMKTKERQQNKAFRRFGAIMRRQSRNKLRRKATKKRTKSAPGEPPLTHKKQEPNLRTILYGINEDGDGVVIGPVGFKSAGRTVPETLEFGHGKHEARPWMNPALQENYHEFTRSLEIFGLV